ncbi:MAG: hypothetical protein JO246_03440, partial [Frankiaceae bacterium]|nr:hypothetical protein [Frankiaceae bacterium]
MRQNPVTLTSGTPGIEYVLNFIEEALADDRLVPTWHRLALVYDVAEVVGITQHLVKLAIADGLGAPPGGRSGGQPEVGHRVSEPLEREITARVQLEGLPHERSPFFVQADGVYEAPFDLEPNVLVSDLGAADRSTAAGLVLKLRADVLTAHADLNLVHDVGDTLHGVRPDALAEILFRGDEFDAHR